jgi:hypothetical protein
MLEDVLYVAGLVLAVFGGVVALALISTAVVFVISAIRQED